MFNNLIIFVFINLYSLIFSQECADSGGNPVDCKLRCQFDDDGSFYNNADRCKDELPDCELLFGCASNTPACVDPWTYANFVEGDPSTYPKVRSAACDAPGLADLASKCAFTCKLCCEKPEFLCYNDPDWTDWCVANQDRYCNDKNWTVVMAELCGQTCGLCDQRACIDKAYDCEGLYSLCRDVEHHEYMKEMCPATCGFCPTSTVSTTTEIPSDVGECVDEASNCEELKHVCREKKHFKLMVTHCKKTCEICTNTNTTDSNVNNDGINGAVQCFDRHHRCQRWVSNGFCQENFYSTAIKRMYCAQSCGLC